MPTIDDSVVRLSLDDSQFDRASDRTIKKLDDLKASLDFNGSVEGFKEIEKAARQTDLSPLQKSAEAVSLQFNALYTIADTAFRRITNAAVDSGERLIKSLTIDNVTAGWDKYADKTSAVQTIMAATAKQFSDTNEQMEYVENQLEKLNWFTDETSYSFLDMVNNIGKFTSNNISLEDSVTAMQGISTWAAISGANVNEAGRAMYNLSQAMATGALKLQDWMSIENANMGTAQFKEIAIEAGVALGTVKDLGNGIYQTLKGTQLSVSNFRETLSEGWLSGDVLMKTLAAYGEFTNVLYEFSEATDMSATPLLGLLEDYADGALDMEEAMEETGLAAEELIEWLEKLSDSELELGNRAFRAAQEAKTFQEALDATKEAVASGWMQSFEYIFGNYQEAKKLWSDLAEGLYEVFVESGNMRNGLLRDWKALNGRTYLLEGLYKVFGNLRDAIYFFKDTIEEIFPPKTAEDLVAMTKGFSELMDTLTPSENTVNAFHNALTLVLTALKKFGQTAVVIFAGLEPIWQLIGEIAGAIVGLVGDISELLGFSLDGLFSEDALTNLYYILYDISTILATIGRLGLTGLVGVLGGIVGFINDIFTTYKLNGGGLIGFINAVKTNFQILFQRIHSGGSIISIVVDAIKSAVQNLFNYISHGDSIFAKIYDGAKNTFDGIKEFVEELFSNIGGNKEIDASPVVNFFKSVGETIENSGLISNIQLAGAVLLKFVADMFGFVANMDDVAGNLRIVIALIGDEIKALWGWLKEEVSGLSIRDVTDILLLMSLANFINALGALSKSLKTVVTSFTGIGTSITSLITAITNVIENKEGSGIITFIQSLTNLAKNTKYLQIGVAITMIVNSLIDLAYLPVDQLGVAIGAIITVLGFLTLLEKSIGNTIIKTKKKTIETAAANVLKMAASIAILTGALTLLSNSILHGATSKDAEGNKRIDWNNEIGALVASIISIGVLMLEIAGLVKLINMINPGKEFAKAAQGMKAVGLGILELSVSVAILSILDVTKMMSAAAAIGVLMLAFGGAAAMMGNVKVASIIAATSSMTLMAIAITAFLAPMFILSELLQKEGNKINEAFNGIVDLILVMGVLSAAIGKFGSLGGAATLLAAGAAMVAFAASVTIMAAAMKLFNDMKAEDFAKGLTLITRAFIGFGAIILVAQTAAVGLLALAGVFISIAAAFALFATTIKIVADAATEFALITAMFIALGDQLGEEFPAKLHQAMDNVELIVREFLLMVANLSMDIAAAAFEVILALKYGFLKALPDIINALSIIGLAILELLIKFGPPIIDTLTRLIESLIPGIPKLLGAIGKFIEELFAGIGDILYYAVIGVIRGVLSALGMKKLGNMIADKLYEVGGYTAEGFADGINDSENDIYNSGENLGEAAIQGMADGAGVASPSWKAGMIGDWIGEGFMNSMSDLLPAFEDSGFSTMASHFSGMITGAEQGGKTVSNVMDGILQMVGVKSNKIRNEIAELQMLQDEMELSPSKRKQNDKQMAASTTASASKAGASAGTAFTNSFDSAATKAAKKSGSGSSAGKVQTAAEKIVESYKKALEELDYLDKKYKGEYDLWEVLNIDVSELEKKTAKLELANKEVETQMKRTQIAQEKYEKIAKAMGKTSQEARDAEVEWVNQQISLAKLQNEVVEIQNDIIADAAKQLELQEKNSELTYNLWVSTNKNASQVEQEQKKLEYTMAKLEYSSNKVAKATEEYNKALEKYGEGATETKEAMNALLEAQKDYADISNEVNDIQKSIIDLGKQQAEVARENLSLEYEIWLEANKFASYEEKEAKKTEDILRRYEGTMADLTEATEKWKKACENFGEESLEAAQAYSDVLNAQKQSMETYAELGQQQKDYLDYLTEEISISNNRYELEDQLWEATNENATEAEKHNRNVLTITRKQVMAQQELIILERKYNALLQEEGEDSQNTMNAYADILSKRIEIAGYVNEMKDAQMNLLEIEKKNLEFEQKRLTISDSYWKAANANATAAQNSAHDIEKINYQMVLSMREINNLSEQYAKQVERYGETSDQARAAWESYLNAQIEMLELQNERKKLTLEMIENELEMTSILEKRAKTEYDLWEALNQDADESQKKTKQLTYQMQTLETATEKLRNASKKYNYALKVYGEEAKETQQLYNDMLDAQLAYAQTYNEIKRLQQDTIEKNNEILEQLNYSEQLLNYGYNIWEKMFDDLSDAQKIEAEISKLGKDLTLQVQRANYYGAEWKKAVAKYGGNSAEAQEAYLAYLEALYKAVDLQSSLEQKEKDLTNKRAEDAQKIQDVWDEITAKDLVGGTSIYDELVEMGLSEAEIEAYVREKAGVIEDTIDAEMDFSIEHMQSKAEESLREWGMTWMDGVYTVADDVVTTAGDCMADMTDIIADGAQEGIDLAADAMKDIDRIIEEGGDKVVGTAETFMNGMVDAISSASTDAVNAMEGVINDVVSSQVKGTEGVFRRGYTIGDYLATGVGQGILSRGSYVIDSMVRVIENAIWEAQRAAQIHSPSRITMWMGAMLDAGFIKGIESRAGEIALSLTSAVRAGLNAMAKLVHTDNTFDFAGRMISDGIVGGFDNYSYNVLSIGQETLNSLEDEYDDMVSDIAGENQWLLDALRDYGFDETTHGIEFVVNLNADEARTQLENLFDQREADLEYYDELLDLQERNAAKDQSDLAVQAERNAINRELNRIIAAIESSEKAIEDIVDAGRAKNFDDTIYGKKLEYIQNIYSSKPLSALDIYRNTNSQLLKFTAWR